MTTKFYFYCSLFLCFNFLIGCKSSPTTSSELSYEIKLPENKSAEAPLLILLHGWGSNEKDLFSFAPHVSDQFIVAAPRAPQTLENNKYAWYELTPPVAYNYKISDVQQAIHKVKEFTDYLIEKYNVDRSRIILGGFSQGAILSLGAGMMYPEVYKSVLSMSGHLYPEYYELADKQSRDLNIFISHGYQDEVLLASDIRQHLKKLENLGYNLEFSFSNTPHTISDQNFRDMKKFLEEQL